MRYTRNILPIFLTVSLLLISGCKGRKNQQATPEEISTTKNVGMAYLEENQLDKAEAEFLKLIKMSPEDAGAYANLGLVYLRMANYEEAEKWLKKAMKISPDDPDIRLILAKVYEMSSRPEEAITVLEESLKTSPGHVKTLYSLAELYSSLKNDQAAEKQLLYTRLMAEKAPANIVPRLNLTDLYIQAHETDSALKQLEEMQQIFPAFPKEATEYFNKTVDALQAGNDEEASVSFMIFHNYMKVTPPYQAGILELKGPEGFVGSPVITFDKTKTPPQLSDWKAVLAAIKFRDITGTAGLDTALSGASSPETIPGAFAPAALEVADFDGDGDMDIYTGIPATDHNKGAVFLYGNEWGKYSDITAKAGIRHTGASLSAAFVDYDNDGFLDLYLVRNGANILYKNNGDGTFSDVTHKSGTGDPQPGTGMVFFDYDHDGDLDFYILRKGNNLLYRNNADGTFTDETDASGLSGNGDSRDAVFADFDDDGDIDLFVVNNDASCILYSNQRQGVYKDITGESGITSGSGSSAVTLGDYNNDGFPDLFVASLNPGQSILYKNLGNGTFEKDLASEDIGKTLHDRKTVDAEFLDFDNDGYLDLIVSTIPAQEGNNGLYLLHNDASGRLFLAEDILPENLRTVKKILTFDYNEDGDMDLLLKTDDNGVRLLRNDGGNNFHYVRMKLVGLRTGSGKNNYYGIGAKVEVRAGNLYQSMTVTRPEILLGLGPRKQADVIRILWTNGVPQNIFYPATDRDLVEEQQLKGSCPFLYTWDGSRFVFVKDIMWRSALGMPLGIMGEDHSAQYASPEPSSDYIKIPGNMLKPRDGKYVLQVTDELWESIYFDKVQLIAVDHPDSVDIYVDERFMPPADYRIWQAGKKYFPVAATDQNGHDVLPLLLNKDDRYVSGLKPTQYQGIVEMQDLVLDLGNIKPGSNVTLYLNGWIFPSDASINASIAQSGKVKLIAPYLEWLNDHGEWEKIGDISFPMGKNKTIVENLNGKIPGGNTKLRIRTNMQVFWDQIFFTTGSPGIEVKTTELNPVAANLHYRGFSRTYRKGGRYGPHWFDYSQVSTEHKWRDLTGYYTRYGDVLPLLTEADDKYIIKNAGDETTITFDAGSLPQLQKGWKRDFLIHSVGWVKDGDLNTATGQQVAPLPYHGMKQYPYGPEAGYPKDPEHQKYLKEYNTRLVTTDDFRRSVAESKSK